MKKLLSSMICGSGLAHIITGIFENKDLFLVGGFILLALGFIAYSINTQGGSK